MQAREKPYLKKMQQYGSQRTTVKVFFMCVDIYVYICILICVYIGHIYTCAYRNKIVTSYSTVYLAAHYETAYKYRHSGLKLLLRHNFVVSDHTVDVSYELFPCCFTLFFILW